jgi:hypothetical protein
MRILCVLAFLLFFAAPVFGQNPNVLRSIFKNYTLRFDLSLPPDYPYPDWYMNGYKVNAPGTVSISRKGEEKPFQVLKLESIQINPSFLQWNQAIQSRLHVMYDTEYSFMVDDFNFDGEEDLAICNGFHAWNGSTSYEVFLFDKKAGRFVHHPELSRLTTGKYIGMFRRYPGGRQVIADFRGKNTIGEEYYRLVNNRPVLIEKTTVTQMENGYRLRIHLKKVRGRWVKQVSRYK